jgi:prophage DNA circulation protein
MGVFTHKESYIAGSFGGVSFRHISASSGHGVRNQPHEFFKGDRPFTEDFGRRVRTFSIEGILCGDDHVAQKHSLARACESGPNVLHHPYFGIITCVCDTIEFSDSKTTERTTTFSASFIEQGFGSGGDIFSIIFDNRAVLLKAIGAGLAGAFDSFNEFSVTERGPAVASLHKSFQEDFREVVARGSDTRSKQYETAFNYRGTDPRLAFRSFVAAARSATIGIQWLQRFRNWKEATSFDTLDNQSASAYSVYVRATAAISAAHLCMNSAVKSKQEADARFRDVYNFLEEAAAYASSFFDDVTRDALMTVAVELQKDTASQLASLPTLYTKNFDRHYPSLVLAMKLYGDASRRTELEEGNRPIHPMWMNRCVEYAG